MDALDLALFEQASQAYRDTLAKVDRLSPDLAALSRIFENEACKPAYTNFREWQESQERLSRYKPQTEEEIKLRPLLLDLVALGSAMVGYNTEAYQENQRLRDKITELHIELAKQEKELHNTKWSNEHLVDLAKSWEREYKQHIDILYQRLTGQEIFKPEKEKEELFSGPLNFPKKLMNYQYEN